MVRSAHRLVLAFVFVLSGASAAAAQSAFDQVAALKTLSSVGQHVWTDRVMLSTAPGVQSLLISGWGFECSTGDANKVAVVIDGIESVPEVVMRAERDDVWQWAFGNGVCDAAHIPYYSGINVFLTANTLTPGLHTAALKIYNAQGVSLLSPKAMAFVVPDGQ